MEELIFKLLAVLFIAIVAIVIFACSKPGAAIIAAMESKEKEKQAKSILYPVLVGYNGYNISFDVVADKFSGLSRLWESFYFDQCFSPNNDLLVYQFRVLYPVNPQMSKARRMILARREAEKVFALQLREHGCAENIENFVAVVEKEDILLIVVAVNPAGFERIRVIRQQNKPPVLK